MKTAQHILLPAFAAIWLTACVTDPNSPGLEYMPDMYRSPAIEAYVDYGQEPYEVGEEIARAQRNTGSNCHTSTDNNTSAEHWSKPLAVFPTVFGAFAAFFATVEAAHCASIRSTLSYPLPPTEQTAQRATVETTKSTADEQAKYAPKCHPQPATVSQPNNAALTYTKQATFFPAVETAQRSTEQPTFQDAVETALTDPLVETD